MDSGEVPADAADATAAAAAAARIVSNQFAVAPPHNSAVMPAAAAPCVDPNHPFIAGPAPFFDPSHLATSASARRPTPHANITYSVARPPPIIYSDLRPPPAAGAVADLIPSARALGKRDRTPRCSHPGWVMLDGFLRRSCGDHSSCANFAYAFTSTGDVISVGFKAAAPPGASRLVFNWTTTRTKKKKKWRPTWSPDAAKAVAVHRNSFLLRFLPRAPSSMHREEFFVYQPLSTALSALPACGHTVNSGDGNSMGILCRGGGKFVAAHLMLTKRDCPAAAELCFMHSQEGRWHNITSLPIQHGQGMAGDLWWWTTDAVVAFGDYIVWVDYLRGLILCDVCSFKPELRYVPLPVKAYTGREGPMGLRGAIFAHRSVCVAKYDSVLKFVDAASSELWFYGGPAHPHGGNDIASWTLCDATLTWTFDGAVGFDRFADLCKALNFQHIRPEFPLVDMEHPQIVYIVLKEESPEESKAVLVGVNMVNGAIVRPTAYGMRGSLFGGEGERSTICCNLYLNEPFLALEMDDMSDLQNPTMKRGIKCLRGTEKIVLPEGQEWDDGYHQATEPAICGN